MSILQQLHRTVSMILCCVCALTIVVGIANDWNVLDLGGPFIEIPVFACSAVLLFLNEGYQVGLLGVR